MIRFKNVTATYKRGTGIKNFTLEVKKGSFIFLTGPAGAGKSTILKCLYGMIPIAGGSLELEGVNLSQASKKQVKILRRKVGFIFQDYKLIKNRTVFDNISIVLHIENYSWIKIVNKTETIMKDLGLSHLSNTSVCDLSYGEQQKLSIARALVKDPVLILADEPTGNLDQNTANEMLSIFKHISNRGITLLIATHDLSSIEIEKEQIVKIENGQRVII